MKRSEWGWTASALTTGNLFFGFWAIVQVLEGNVLMACWFILIAAICDGLDGKLARYTKSSSEIGIELDSLADAVSFGAAPALLIYAISFHKFGFPGVLLSAIPLVFGVYRLARFNRDATKEEKKYYCGLPIPIAANTTAMFIVFNYAVWGYFRLEILLIPLVIILAMLMVSRIHYSPMPRFTVKETGKNLLWFTAIIIGIALVAYHPPMMFFPFLLIYVMKGVVDAVFIHPAEEEELEEIEDILGD